MNTVIFDFDGVIHSYETGWHGAGVITDPPVPEIGNAIQEIRDAGYKVVVVSSRCYQPGGMTAILEYLDKHEIKVDGVTDEKPPAIVSIDDRAICFTGDPGVLLEQIKGFKTWNNREV